MQFKDLKTTARPVKTLALFTIPFIMVCIITFIVALGLSILTPVTFNDVTSSAALWVLNIILYVFFLAETGEWLHEKR
jgi:membrane protein YdbS with pleckstrin-like domain